MDLNNPFLMSIDRQPEMSAPSPDKITFGKYKGAEFDEVPASYLLWLWDKEDGLWCDESVRNKPLRDYIIHSFKALQQECPDKLVYHGPTSHKKKVYKPLEVYVEPTLTDSEINNNDDIPF